MRFVPRDDNDLAYRHDIYSPTTPSPSPFLVCGLGVQLLSTLYAFEMLLIYFEMLPIYCVIAWHHISF